MTVQTTQHISAKSFQHYPNAAIDHFEFRENGVICYYTKDGQQLQMAGADLIAIAAMWNMEMI